MGDTCASQYGGGGQRSHGAYNQVADEDLHDLGLQALAAPEHFLQDADEDVAERRTDKGAVDGHFGDARGEVVAVLAAVMGNPRGKKLLQTREGARGEHFGAQRVLLQLLEVGLRDDRQCLVALPMQPIAHSLRDSRSRRHCPW
jgi:hypothetical protein